VSFRSKRPRSTSTRSPAGRLRTGNGLVLAEGAWKHQRRPYYNVWPAIVPTDTDARTRRTSTATVATVAELGRPG
jgi:hypothetical protein